MVLNAQGEAVFTLQSTGTLIDPNIAGYALPIQALIIQGPEAMAGTDGIMLAAYSLMAGEPPAGAEAKVVVQKASIWARTLDYLEPVKQFGWGAVWGDGEGVAGAAGDITASVTPVLGMLADGRDLMKELARIVPGGNDPDWAVAGFAFAGLVAEIPFFKSIDWFPAIMKNLSKSLRRGGALRDAFYDIAWRAARNRDPSELTKYKDFLTKLVGDPDFKQLADKTLVASKDGFARLTKITDALGIDTATELFKQTAAKFGSRKAKLLQDSLSRASTEQLMFLKSADKLDVVAYGVGKGEWGAGGRAAAYADKARDLGANNSKLLLFDEFADIPGSGKILDKGLDAVQQQAELTVAKLQGKQNIERLGLEFRLGSGELGEVDVVTKTKVIEVKSGNPNNYSSNQLNRLRSYAAQEGKTPVFAVRREEVENMSPELRKLLDREPKISLEPFDI